MKKITEKQELVLDYIKKNTRPKSPTYQEIMEGVGLSNKQAVWQRVEALRRKGYLDNKNLPTGKEE